MIKLKQTLNFGSEARTLDPSDVGAPADATGHYERTHENGWTVSGIVREDYYTWVNDFVATHPDYGTVKGDFEEVIYTTSMKAYRQFLKSFHVQTWDYQDI